MNNIRDWCISRQLWWGHRIPAFYCDDCGHITVEETDPDKCEKCSSTNIRQESDVLDTWFSSGLWPFSTLGWPEKTKALQKYYPTSALVTGFDIIFFWVARMIMMGQKFMNDVPFRDVYIHALVRDEHGHKMSKSRGNVIDPLIMMDKFGTDAFRFTLAMLAAQGRDIIMSEKRIEGYRAFCNKIWNAARFIVMNLGEGFEPRPIEREKLGAFDKWILHRLNEAVNAVTTALEEYRFNEAAHTVYGFVWHELCDWYLELTKHSLYKDGAEGADAAARQVLYHVLCESLKLLHPFMPFITEDIWGRIKTSSDRLLIISDWPAASDENRFEKEAADAALFQELIYKIRNIRGEMGVPPEKKASVVFKTNDADISSVIKRESEQIKALARLKYVSIDPAYVSQKTDASAVIQGCEIFMPLKGLIDFELEKARLEKELARATADLERVEKKLSNANFISKAKPEVIENERNRQRESTELILKLRDGIAKIMR
jgi:valyl-tRNA synthetase